MNPSNIVKAAFDKVVTKVNAAWNAMLIKALEGVTASRNSRFAKNKRGAVDIVDLFILGIAFVGLSYLMPMGITAAVGANTTTWDPNLKTIWTVFWPAMGTFVAIIFLIYSIKNGHS